MTWSLKNYESATKVEELLDEDHDRYPPDVERGLSRETALAVIHAAIWAYGVRADSFAAGYALRNLDLALGLSEQIKAAEEKAKNG